LADDAYIYFRYIDNLLFLRAGLVFNQGEFVEGFSSPVWTLLIIILRAFRVGYFTIARFVAILTFPLFWALLVIINRKLSEGNDTTLIVNFPVIHLSLNYGVLSYFTSGLETPLVQVSGVAYAAFLFFPNSLWLQFTLGLSPFVRHDLLLPCIIAILWFIWQKKRIPITLVVTFLSVGVALAVFRIYYYAELLPNTFYLKDLMWISQGLVYVKDTLLAYRLNYIFPFFFLCLCGLWYFAKASTTLHISQRLMMLIFGLTVTAYVVKIGGDPRHYRYLAFPYCVIMCSTGGLIEHLLGRLRVRVPPLQVFLLGSGVALFTIIQYPRQLSRHPIFYENQHLEVEKINDAVFQRGFELINPSSAWGADADKPLLSSWREQK